MLEIPDQPVRIDPEAIYAEDTLAEMLRLSPQVMASARRDGELKFSKRGRRIFYVGSWVLDWLRGETK